MKLNSGYEMPIIGLGTSSIFDPQSFYNAIEVGYRHFDTATKYRNEEFIGEAISRAI